MGKSGGSFDTGAAKLVDEPCQIERHDAGVGGQTFGSCNGIQVSTPLFRFAWKTGFGLASQEKDHFCPRMFLAPTQRMSKGNAAERAYRVLEREVQKQCCARSKEFTTVKTSRLVCTGALAVSNQGPDKTGSKVEKISR